MESISTPVTYISATTTNSELMHKFHVNYDYLRSSGSISTFTTRRYPATLTTTSKNDSYSSNLKLISILVAGVILSIVGVRLCLMLCRSSRSSNNASTSRAVSGIQPQISTIGLTNFKPDLPPPYPEAVANVDIDESKLPSYDELHNPQSERAKTTV